MSKYITKTDTFTSEIFHLWPEISYDGNVNSLDHFLSLPLWYKSLIRIDDKPVFYKSWYSLGIQNTVDLFKDEKAFLSLHELKERFHVKTNFLALFDLQLPSLQLLRKTNARQQMY